MLPSDAANALIRSDVPKAVLEDMANRIRETRAHAFECVELMGLVGSDAASQTGFGHYRLVGYELQRIAEKHGGEVISRKDFFPGTEMRAYETLARFGRVILGYASISDPEALPTKVLTRLHGVLLNRRFATVRSLFSEPSKSEDLEGCVFATILVCRDRKKIGTIQELALGVIEPDFSRYIGYTLIDEFIATYGEVADPAWTEPLVTPLPLELKKDAEPFVGGEAMGPGDSVDDTKFAS